jgi:hypothetical protein
MQLWGEFGYLCHSIISSPMKSSALQNNLKQNYSIWKSREKSKVLGEGALSEMNSSHSNVNNIAENPGNEGGVTQAEKSAQIVSTFKRKLLFHALECFNEAKKLNPGEWQFPFMIAKTMRKILPMNIKVCSHN